MNIEELIKELETLKKESENTTDKLTLLIKRIKSENVNEVTLDLKTRQAIQDAVRKEIEKQSIIRTSPLNPIEPYTPQPINPNQPFNPPIQGPLVWYCNDTGAGCNGVGQKIYGVSPLNPPPIHSFGKDVEDENGNVKPI